MIINPHRSAGTGQDPDVERAAALAEGLRGVAALLAGHPDLTKQCSTGLPVYVHLGYGEDVREQLVAFARAGVAAGATVTEEVDTSLGHAGVNVAFGPVTLHAYGPLDLVHEVTRHAVEYTERPILAEITGTGAADGGPAAVVA
jgi:hypothetical protein